MIRVYEAYLAKKFRDTFPVIKAIQYSDEIADLYQLSKRLAYPSLMIVRKTDSDAVNHRSFDVETEIGLAKVFTFDQLYAARIYMSKEREALDYLSVIRFAFERNPYVRLILPDESTLDIGMRILYIKKEEEFDGDAAKGPRRYVELSWKSTLPIVDEKEYPLINSVRFTIQEDKTIIEYK